MINDRRTPVARYVQFRDVEGRQRSFIDRAEAAYADLTRADAWTADAVIELPSEEPVVSDRRGLFRKSKGAPDATVRAIVTPGLAQAYRAAAEEPVSMSALPGCMAGRRLAALIGEVLGELVGDLAAMGLPEQKAHAAYRQTLRLTAELAALTQVTRELGCSDPLGCVALRPPEHWGRREEDVEVTEVRAVLLELAHAAARAQGD